MGKSEQKNIEFMFVLPGRKGGGAERVVSVLASGLAERGHSVCILQFVTQADEYPVHDDVIVHRLELDKEAKGSKLKFVKKWVRYYKPKYVIPFLGNTAEYSLLATLFTKSKCIGTIRNNPEKNTESKKYKFIRKITFRLMDAVFAQTKEQTLYYSKAVQRKSFVVPNPVSDVFVNAEYNYRENVSNIIAVGRLTEQKNYPLLFSAFKEVHKEFPELKLNVYGVGPLNSKFEDAIKRNGLEDCIILHGRTNDVASALCKSDLYIMSSDFEGFPNSLMEAMTVGMPCISTDCPTGPSELITTGVSGELIEVGNKQELINAIKKMIISFDYRKSCGQNARKFVLENLTVENIVIAFINEVKKV